MGVQRPSAHWSSIERPEPASLMRKLILPLILLFGWAFMKMSNLPDPTPPRWSLADCATYRWYSFVDGLGFGLKLTAGQKYFFAQYISQGIEYRKHLTQFEQCARTYCHPLTLEALRNEQSAWQSRVLPR
jgi:hypothetical protein